MPEDERRRKYNKVIIVGVCGLVALFIAVWLWLPERPPPLAALNFNQTKICEKAFEQTLDYKDANVNRLPPIVLQSGCFDSLIRLPQKWDTWFYQPAEDRARWWVAFWIVGEAKPRGPFGGQANPNFDIHKNFFRLQGEGRIVIYTNDVVPPHVTNSTSHPSFTATSYQERFCDEPKEQTPEGDSMILTLTEGCFNGPIVLPHKSPWMNYHIDKSRKEGDWGAVWCNGREHPSNTHPYYEDFDVPDFKDCGKFYLQGKGTVHFTAIK